MAKKKKETKAKKEETKAKKEETKWINPLENCKDASLILLRDRLIDLFERANNRFDAAEEAYDLFVQYEEEDEEGNPRCYWGDPFASDWKLIDRFTVELHDSLPPQILAHLITLLHRVEQGRNAEREQTRRDHRVEVYALETKIKELEKKGGSK
jgi:hypothetical protein